MNRHRGAPCRGWPAWLGAGLLALSTATACQPNPADVSAANAAMARGQQALGTQQWDAAIAAFSEAIQHQPARADAYLARSAAAFAKGDLDLAEQDCTRVIALHPRTPNDVPALVAQMEAEAYERRGEIAYRRQDYAAALRDLSYAVKLGGTHAYYTRGLVLRALGERERARLDLMGGGPCNMCMLEH